MSGPIKISGLLMLALASVAAANVLPDRDDQFIAELKQSKVPVFYAACDFGSDERLVWFFSAPGDYGMLIVYDRATGEGSTFGTIQLDVDGQSLGAEMAHGAWQLEKYAKGPYGAAFFKNHTQRAYRMFLPGSDFLPAILAREDIAECGSPEDMK